MSEKKFYTEQFQVRQTSIYKMHRTVKRKSNIPKKKKSDFIDTMSIGSSISEGKMVFKHTISVPFFRDLVRYTSIFMLGTPCCGGNTLK